MPLVIYVLGGMHTHTYGTAQWQLDTRTHVNSEKRVGQLNDCTINLCECPAQLKSLTVRLIV